MVIIASVVSSTSNGGSCGASFCLYDGAALFLPLLRRRRVGQAEAEKTVAVAELQRIKVGTRPEIIAQRKAEIDRAVKPPPHPALGLVALGEIRFFRRDRLRDDTREFALWTTLIGRAALSPLAGLPSQNLR